MENPDFFSKKGFSTGGFQLHFVHNPRKADAAPGKKRMGVADLEKYYRALDKALMTYHTMKISKINGIIQVFILFL